MKISRLSVLSTAVLTASLGASISRAGTPAQPPENGHCTEEQKEVATTEHDVTIGGKPIHYTAKVGFLEVTVDPNTFAGLALSSGGSPGEVATAPYTGCFFYTAYSVKPEVGAPARPITFAFNGGPGSASLWLHLGLMGPRRVVTGPTGLGVPNPPELEDNANSPLDLTDIVMIDPVGTGFSHAKKPATPPAPASPPANHPTQNFFGAIDDAESVSTFIKSFITTFHYGLSPVYVLGESYGGVRGSLVSQILPSALGTYPKGMIFVSPCLSSTTYDWQSADLPIPYLAFFPTMAEIARYHGKGIYAGKESTVSDEDLFRLAYDFALKEFVPALMQGTNLSPDDPDYRNVQQKLADFTGMPFDYFGSVKEAAQVSGKNLRMQDQDFFSDLFPGEQIGRFDGRWRGVHTQDKRGYYAPDPSDTNTSKAFVPAINQYLSEELKMVSSHPYVDSANISFWPMSSDSTEFVATQNLGYALAQNPDLQVFIASGYYDMACPMGGEEYERGQVDRIANGLAHGKTPSGRIQINHYPAGHMIYTNPEALVTLKQDLARFYARTTKLAPPSIAKAP